MNSDIRDRLLHFFRHWIRFIGLKRIVATCFTVVALVGIAWFVLAPSPVPVETVLPRAQETSSSIQSTSHVFVHVAGAVKRPGVYKLNARARIVDAVTAAGGASPRADLNSINLAQTVSDAEQVFIPSRVHRSPRATVAPRHRPRPSSTTQAPGTEAPAPRTVNINTATSAQLETLTGVGPATAKAIIAYRNSKGPFTRIEDLLNVPGIGPAKLDAMRAEISVS